MKIALVLESFDPQHGEMEASTFELARHLLRLKHDVHVVAQRFSGAGLEVPIVSHRIRGVRSPLRRAEAAGTELRAVQADIVHDMGITCCADVFTSPVGSPMRMRQCQLAGSAWWARPLKRFAQKRLPRYRQQSELARRQLDESDSVVVAFSEMVAEDHQSLDGLAPDRIRVVYPGVDIKKYAPHIRKLRRASTRKKLGIEGKELLLLAVADKCQQTAWRPAFRALGRLIAKRLPVRLVILADRDAVSAAKLADGFGVGQHVKVVKEVADRIPYYAAADVFFLPTVYTPFSAASLEAAACGLPCITTCHNGASDLFTEEVDSYILPKYSAADLANRIELLLDSARRERMGLAARRTAMKHPLDRSMDKIVEIYEEIAQGRRHAERREGDNLPLFRAAGHGCVARRAA